MTDAAHRVPRRSRRRSTRPREIEALIPHRWPILLVDRIVEYDAEAKRIVGIKGVAATEWFFQGHFPGLAGHARASSRSRRSPRRWPSTSRSSRGSATGSGCSPGSTTAASSGSSCPGDVLRLEITMEKLGSRFGTRRGVASVDGEVACEATLSFVIPGEGVLR